MPDLKLNPRGLKKSLNRRKVIAGIVVIIILISAGAYLFSKSASAQPQYITSKPTKGTFVKSTTVSGSIAPGNIYNAGSPAAANLSEINVKVGDSVKAGQQLAKIDTKELDYKLAQSKAALTKAKNALTDLYERGGYKTREVNELKEDIKLAETQYNFDKELLANATITSQINGIVVAVNKKVGDAVQASADSTASDSASLAAAIVTVMDASSLELIAQVGETEVIALKVGQAAQITIEVLNNKKFTGTVSQLDTIGTDSSGVTSYTVKVKLDSPSAEIRPGMTADASVIIQTKENTLSVPSSAIKGFGDNKFVEVLVDAKPKTVTVKTGISNDSETEITEGLSENDEVITATINTTAIQGLDTQAGNGDNVIQFEGPASGGTRSGGPKQVFMTK